MHLHLSGNAIEDGIEALTAAVRSDSGPAGLHLEMIEFKHESAYLSLLASLTHTDHLTHLSLAGTGPSPGPCTPALLETLTTFLSANTSITALDLSGFSGKLDDGQLPVGFGAALAGLATNTTLTHLRIRNQNLHPAAGARMSLLPLSAVLFRHLVFCPIYLLLVHILAHPQENQEN